MAAFRERQGKDGSTRYTVTWRDQQGRQRGKTTGSKREAGEIKKQAENYPGLGKTDVPADSYITGDTGKPARPRQDRLGNVTVTGYAEHFLATTAAVAVGRPQTRRGRTTVSGLTGTCHPSSQSRCLASRFQTCAGSSARWKTTANRRGSAHFRSDCC